MSGPPRLALALSLVGAVAVVVVAALLMVGGPGTARLARLDEVRARELIELVHAIERHRILTGSLPSKLDQLHIGPTGPAPIRDPATGEPYVYEPLGDTRFRVCAVLAVPRAAPAVPEPLRLDSSRRVAAMRVDPGTGRTCWESVEPPG